MLEQQEESTLEAAHEGLASALDRSRELRDLIDVLTELIGMHTALYC